MLSRRRVIETSSAPGDHRNAFLRPRIPVRCLMTGAATGRRSRRHPRGDKAASQTVAGKHRHVLMTGVPGALLDELGYRAV